MSEGQRRRSRAPSEERAVADLLAGLSQRSRDAGDREVSETARLRAAALQGVERLRSRDDGARWHAIVMRCDIGGETHKAVAADLGLSRRQFYRDLSAARQAVAMEIRREVVRVTPATPELPFAAQLQTAAALAAAGHRRVAVNAFQPVVETMRGEASVWGRGMLAEFLLYDGDVAGADRELALARDACRDAGDSGREHILLIEASKSFEAGRLAETVRVLEDCMSLSQPNAEAHSPLAVETLSRALTLLAFCYQVRGAFHAASAAHARNPAGNGKSVSAMAKIEFLNVNAMLACDGPAGPAGAYEACDAFYEFAAERGFLEDISAALLQKGGVARTQRRLDEAARLARESLAIHRAIGRPSAAILSLLSGVAVDGGESDEAIALAREMRAEASPHTRTWCGAQLHEAEALAQSGRFRTARSACESVAGEAEQDDVRILAWRRRIEAAALAGEGDRNGASSAAGEAIEILGSDAPPFHRLKSLIVAERIRPERRRRGKIRELVDLLGWPKELRTVGRI